MLAWLPDGKYIADGSDAIKIYDVKAKKIIATFGKVDAQDWGMRLIWSPDSTGLASVVTNPQSQDIPSYNTVSIWKIR